MFRRACTGVLFVSLTLALLATAAVAKPPMAKVAPAKAGVSSKQLARARAVAKSFIEQGKVAGAIALFARNGKVVDLWAEGQSDMTAGKPMKTDTIVRIYSMSKIVTSVAVMMLLEQGHFSLTDPIETYLPELGDRQVLVGGTPEKPILEKAKGSVTILHLLTHTAGMPYGQKSGDTIRKLYERADLPGAKDLAQFVGRVGELPLAHHPGERFTYGINTDILGRLVEVVSGQRFQAFLQQNIFKPLGMKDTGFFVPPDKQSRRAVIYEYDPDGKLTAKTDPMWHEICTSKDRCLASGGAGLFSTIGDYARFAQMLMTGGTFAGKRILGPMTIKRMASDHLAPMGIDGLPWESNTGFGLGVSVRHRHGPSSVAWSPGSFGWDGAASTYCRIDPVQGTVTLFFMQHMPMDPSGLVPRFVNIVQGALTR